MKNFCLIGSFNIGIKKKWRRIMRLTFFLMIGFILSVSANSYSQETRLDIKLKNCTIVDLIAHVEDNSEFVFLYKNEDLDLERKMNINLKNVNIFQIMDVALEGQGVNYDVYERQVILSKGESTVPWLNRDRAQQERTVTGVVSDQGGNPLPGVTILVTGTTTGTVTDANGEFTLSIPGDAETLQFSFVGMRTQEIPIAGRTTFTIVMEEETIGIEEVVAVGYGVQKKENLTGSVSTVNMNQVDRKVVSHSSQALAGEISGISVRQGSGEAGGEGASIRIRGLGTFSGAGNSPLVLIDGIPSSIDNVDPNDIENISVLKDAASAAIYGSRAGNGVILITTKKGKKGKLEVNYDSHFGMQNATELPQFADSWNYARAYNEANINMGRGPVYSDEVIAKYESGEDTDSYPNVHHLEDLLTSGNGFQTKHNLTFKDGSDRMQYLFSAGYLKKNGMIEKNQYNRTNVLLNLTSELSNNFKLNLNINGNTANHEIPASHNSSGLNTLVDHATRLPNVLPGKRSDGTYGHIEYTASEAYLDSKGFGLNEAKSFLSNATLDWDIINSLKLSGTIGYSWNYNQQKDFMPEIVMDAYQTVGPSRLRIRKADNRYLISQILLNYDKTFFDHHNLSVLAGYSQESNKNQWTQSYRDNLPNDLLTELNAASESNMQNSGNAAEWALISYFGRLKYSFKEKYLLETNIRYDGSSRFPQGKRYGLFPSFSAAWRVSEEDFFQISWIDNLKIRASHGTLGNQQIGNYPYQKILNPGFGYTIGDSYQPGVSMTTLPFEDISWETIIISDIGFDVSLLDGKLNFTADYFYKKTKDILYQISVANLLGLSASEQNAGIVQNKGWDFELSYNNTINDFSYSISSNFSFVQNKVLELANVERDINMGLFVGEQLQAIYGFEADGLFIDQDDIDNYPVQPYNAKPGLWRFKDISGPEGVPDGKVTFDDDRKVIGSQMPNFMYGMGITANYKKFDLFVQLQGEGGNQRQPRNWMYAFLNAGNIQQWQWEERWTTENPDRYAKYPRLEHIGGGSYFTWPSTYWNINGTFLRLKNVQVGYTFPPQLIKFLSDLRIYVSGENLITFDNSWPGWDPEMTLYGSYPPARLLSFGINANF